MSQQQYLQQGAAEQEWLEEHQQDEADAQFRRELEAKYPQMAAFWPQKETK